MTTSTTTTVRTSAINAARAADTKIAAAWDLYWVEASKVVALRGQIKANDKMIRYYGSRAQGQTDRLVAANDKLRAAIADLQPVIESTRQAAVDLDAKLYKGWSRFFLVQHIHSSQHCSSFRPTTRIQWLPNVSGLTEAEAVAAHGETLCTICFPSAPTELTTKAADPAICTGKAVQPIRMGYVSGNYGTCSDCGQRISISTAGNLRKHKA